MKHISILVLFVLALLFTGCGDKNTNIAFSFDTSEPQDSVDKKVIYFNEDYDNVVLNAKLQMDSGKVLMEITGPNDRTVWEASFEESGKYRIELSGVAADEEYILNLRTEQTKKMTLNISSSVKLVMDKEKPMHPPVRIN